MRWKYEKEFIASRGRKGRFIQLCLEVYPNSKEDTMRRQFYDLRKKFKDIKCVVTTDDDENGDDFLMFISDDEVVRKPNKFKMLQFEDIKKFGNRALESNLRRYGFGKDEIAWLKREKLI